MLLDFNLIYCVHKISQYCWRLYMWTELVLGSISYIKNSFSHTLYIYKISKLPMMHRYGYGYRYSTGIRIKKWFSSAWYSLGMFEPVSHPYLYQIRIGYRYDGIFAVSVHQSKLHTCFVLYCAKINPAVKIMSRTSIFIFLLFKMTNVFLLFLFPFSKIY